jgi:hypothetical protein
MKNLVLTMKACNRPGYFQKAMESIANCTGVEDWKIIIGLEPTPISDEHIKIAKQFKDSHKLDLTIYLHDKRQGCAGNARFCLEKGFEESDFVLHTEDDIILSKGTLQYFESLIPVYTEDPEMFAVCSFNRNVWAEQYPNQKPSFFPEIGSDNNKLYLRRWFEMGGTFMLCRREWDLILKEGGMYGVMGECDQDRTGIDWKSELQITDWGSWGWTFNKHFRGNKYCLFPVTSRTQNIGEIPFPYSTFNPSEEFHKKCIYDPTWIGKDGCKEEQHEILDEFIFADPQAGTPWLKDKL